jgi:hypothetical protein
MAKSSLQKQTTTDVQEEQKRPSLRQAPAPAIGSMNLKRLLMQHSPRHAHARICSPQKRTLQKSNKRPSNLQNQCGASAKQNALRESEKIQLILRS